MDKAGTLSSFTAMTGWQTDDWFVEIRIGGFGSKADAEMFATTSNARLVFDQQSLSLHLILAGGSVLRPLKEEEVRVLRQKPETKDELTTTMDDYVHVPMLIQDFAKEPDLCRGFGSCYYAIEQNL